MLNANIAPLPGVQWCGLWRKCNITCLHCCRALIAYVNILADVLSSVAGTIVPPGAEPSRNVMMAAITFMGAL